MPKTNFSTENQRVFDLMLDLARDDYSVHIDKDKLSKRDLENHLRNTINDNILKGASLYQAYRRNNIVLCEIVEEITNVTISEDVMSSPFIEAFVEVKNRYLGDKTSFYSEGGLLEVASFAGNYWGTNRQSLDLGSEFTLKREWFYIHVYEELERFLLGITPLEKMMDKIYKSINKYLAERLYVLFNSISDAVPSEFALNGNSEEALGNAVDLVQTAGGYSSMIIAGTKGALRKLANVVPDKFIATSQKEAKSQSASIGVWEGNALMVIPQVFKSGTFEFALDDSTLFILGGDTKPIKLEFFGDTRSWIDTEGKKNNDMTVDVQLQTCMGLGLLLDRYLGKFTFA